MSFLGRIFGAPSRAADPENWQVGDWAECVHAGSWFAAWDGSEHPGPRLGRIGRVTGVETFTFIGKRFTALSFEPWPGCYFNAVSFRKLTPRADEATAAEAEFTALVKRRPTPALPAETIREFQ